MAIVTSPVGRRPSVRALSPEHATDEERSARFARALLGTATGGQREAAATGRRGRARGDMRDVERVRRRSSARGRWSRAGRTRSSPRERSAQCSTEPVSCCEPDPRASSLARGGVKLATLANDSALARSHQGPARRCEELLGEGEHRQGERGHEPRVRRRRRGCADDAEAIRLLARRAGEVLGLADGSVVRGPLFRVVDATRRGELTSRTVLRASSPIARAGRFRIANLHSLLRDVDQRGAR